MADDATLMGFDLSAIEEMDPSLSGGARRTRVNRTRFPAQSRAEYPRRRTARLGRTHAASLWPTARSA